MSGARTGTIVELVPVDGLGWIELDDGQRIRFGGTACKGFREFPDVGTRVIVAGTEPGFRGVLKATMVLPADPPAGEATDGDADSQDGSPPMPWPRFVVSTKPWRFDTSLLVVSDDRGRVVAIRPGGHLADVPEAAQRAGYAESAP